MVIYRSLQKAKLAFDRQQLKAKDLVILVEQQLDRVEGVKIQYVELVDPVTLESIEKIEHSGLLAIAAYVGSTRLIDKSCCKNSANCRY